MINGLHITLTSFTHGSRILKETKSLVDSGLVEHVHILGLHEPGLKIYEEIDKHRMVWRIPLRSRGLPRLFIFQIIKYLEVCWECIIFEKKHNYNFINVHNLALLPIGVLLSWLGRGKLIYDAHELETEIYGLTGFRKKLARWVERRFIKYAKLIIVVSDGIKSWYSKSYGLSNVVTVLNCPYMKIIEEKTLLRKSLKIPKKKKIAIYQGGFQRGRGIEAMLRVFAKGQTDAYVLVLMGYGELEPEIIKYSDKYSDIYIKTAVEPGMVLKYTASADIGISYIDNQSQNDRVCLPNKLFEYIMGGIPVIINDSREMRRVVEKHQIGCVISGAFTAKSFRKAVKSITEISPPDMGQNLKKAAKRYCWENQETIMVSAYRKYVISS